MLGIRGTVKQPFLTAHPKGTVTRDQQKCRVVALEPHIATTIFPMVTDECVEIASTLEPYRTMVILSEPFNLAVLRKSGFGTVLSNVSVFEKTYATEFVTDP